MTAQLNTENYKAMAKEAEAAVSAVSDPELRRVAFEKILQTLLEGNVGASKKSRAATPNKKKKVAAKDGRAARKAQRGPKAYVEALIDDDFFKKQRTNAEVKAELANRGHHVALTSLSGPLQKLTQERRLRRQKVASKGKGSKPAYAYSNW